MMGFMDLDTELAEGLTEQSVGGRLWTDGPAFISHAPVGSLCVYGGSDRIVSLRLYGRYMNFAHCGAIVTEPAADGSGVEVEECDLWMSMTPSGDEQAGPIRRFTGYRGVRLAAAHVAVSAVRAHIYSCLEGLRTPRDEPVVYTNYAEFRAQGRPGDRYTHQLPYGIGDEIAAFPNYTRPDSTWAHMLATLHNTDGYYTEHRAPFDWDLMTPYGTPTPATSTNLSTLRDLHNLALADWLIENPITYDPDPAPV